VKPPLYLRLLSYLLELHVESAPSELNPHLYVSLSRGRYQLSTQNAVYSYGDLYDNFARTFRRLDWEVFSGEEVLLLGVGLGSVPYMLETKFGREFSYTGVEIDENVLLLANKYVLRELHSPMTMVFADARSFLRRTQDKFDLICMDVFVDDKIPKDMQTVEFLKMLQNVMAENSLLLYNCLARTQHDISQTKAFLHDVFLPAFPHGGYLDVRGNWMLVSDKRYFQKNG
jgi:hypothetical protein